jgi:acyl carrier protein
MSTLTASELVSQLQEAFAGYLGLEPDEVDPDRPIDELGLDSLTAAQLALDIEDRLGVSVFLNDLLGQETLADLAASAQGVRPGRRARDSVSRWSSRAADAEDRSEPIRIGERGPEAAVARMGRMGAEDPSDSPAEPLGEREP